MKNVILNESDVKLEELLTRTANGERFEILRDGQPVARLVPPPQAPTKSEAQHAADNLLRLVETMKLTAEEVREWKHEGHRF